MSIRKPTKDKRPTTSGLQKEAKDPFPPLGKAQERKQVRSRALFGDCFVEKLTTEDWPGPLLAKDTTVNQETGAARNLSVGLTREKDDYSRLVKTGYRVLDQFPASCPSSGEISRRAAQFPVASSEDLSTTRGALPYLILNHVTHTNRNVVYINLCPSWLQNIYIVWIFRLLSNEGTQFF